MKLYKEKREITRDNGQLYMTRWYLLKNKYFSLMLHKIVLSDHECVHDHPWNFISLILKGGYVEHSEIRMPKGTINDDLYSVQMDEHCNFHLIKKISKIYHPFQILFRKAEHRHRLEIYQPCWTLVLKFKAKRRWGFWTKKGWIHWKQFSEQNNCE